MAEDLNTVKVFISSTFWDMHAERVHLVKVTLPELRECLASPSQCRQRKFTPSIPGDRKPG